MQLLALIDGQGPWRKKVADAAIKCVASSELMKCAEDTFQMEFRSGRLSNRRPGHAQAPRRAVLQRWAELTIRGASLIRRVDRQFPQAEHHLLASCKRDAASMLADMMFEWYVSVYTACASYSPESPGRTRALVILERLLAGLSFREFRLYRTRLLADGRTCQLPLAHTTGYPSRKDIHEPLPFPSVQP
jgi:hypothetical protein